MNKISLTALLDKLGCAVEPEKPVEITVDADIILLCKGNFALSAKNITLLASENITLKATGNLVLKGKNIRHN